MWNLTFLFTGFVFNLFILIIFFIKKPISTKENQIFKLILSSSLLTYFIEIPLQFLVRFGDYESLLVDITAKLYLIILLVLYTFFTIYVFVICLNKKNILVYNRKIKIIEVLMTIICIAFSIILAKLPILKYYDETKMYTYGAAVDTLKIIIGLFILLWLIMLIRNFKELNDKKYVPIYMILLFLIISTIIQVYDPSILISSMISTFVCYTMYFTIENPDVKMLEEFRIAKDRAEKANQEKELFLYNITQDIRKPLGEITKASNWLNENTRNKNVTDATYYINKNASNITDLVNNVLDISTLELTNIKIYDTNYNINNIVKFIEKTYKSKISEKVEFRMNVDSNIPTSLYGDQIRLKQVIQIILENSIKYTKNGFIELNINAIEKNNICRLLISVEDSGTGIKPSEMEQILNKEEHLFKNEKVDDSKSTIAMAKSITNLLGGTLLINSELGKGTKMTIVLDQKIYDEKSLELNKLEKDVDKFIDNTKVMVVIEDEEYREKVVKKLSKYDINLEVVELGSRCLDNIRMSKKYDLIIMDESLKHLSSIDVITKLKEIPSFNIPVALLTENTDNQGYINNGFTYLLERKIPSKEIESILEKVERSSK